MAFVDVLKGIGILAVMLGHRSFSEGLVQIIYFFHMPLFFMISGYLDQMNIADIQGIKVIVKRKFARLMYPYFTLGILIIVYYTALEFFRTSMLDSVKLAKRVIALLYGNFIWENNIDYIGTLWFLPALFWASVIANLLFMILKKGKKQIWIAELVLLVLGYLWIYMYSEFQIRLPWCLDVAIIGTVFYLIGYQYKIWSVDKNKLTLFSIFSLLVGFVLSVLNVFYMENRDYVLLRPDMLRLNYGNLVLFILGASLLSLSMFGITYFVCEKIEFKFLQKVGQLSLLIMVEHLYVFQILDIVLGRLGWNRWLISFPLCFLISFVLAICIERFMPILITLDKKS